VEFVLPCRIPLHSKTTHDVKAATSRRRRATDCKDRTISSFTRFDATSTVLKRKSTPIVLMYDPVYVSSATWNVAERKGTSVDMQLHSHTHAHTRRLYCAQYSITCIRRVRAQNAPKRSNKQDFPTALSPIMTSLKRWSNCWCAIEVLSLP
jgi:hypothetical protein